MKNLTKILKDFEQGEININNAEYRILRLFSNGNSILIRKEMDADMENSGMEQEEIKSCLNHWNNKYIILRKK